MLMWGVSCPVTYPGSAFTLIVGMILLCSFLYCCLESRSVIVVLRNKFFYLKEYICLYIGLCISCMQILHTCRSYTHADPTADPKEGKRSPGTWVLKLQEQRVPLTTRPHVLLFNCFLNNYCGHLDQWSVCKTEFMEHHGHLLTVSEWVPDHEKQSNRSGLTKIYWVIWKLETLDVKTLVNHYDNDVIVSMQCCRKYYTNKL